MNISILGAGTWGVTLARMLCITGHKVTIWSARSFVIDELKKSRMQKNLPYIEIPEAVSFTKDIREACTEKDILLFAVSSVYVRSTARLVAPFVTNNQIIVSVAKGIESETLMTMSEVISSEIPGVSVVVLSGPTHAEEVARDISTTIVAAHEDISIAEKIQSIFTNSVMRVYTNTDVKGVELCGALKNTIALASGI